MVHPEGTESPPGLVQHRPEPPARIVVLVSGSGTNLQALIDAERADEGRPADTAFGGTIVAVGADRTGIQGLERAEQAGIPTFALRVKDFATREDWDRALRDKVAEYRPDLVVSAGFMKLLGPDFLAAFGGRVINTHPALSPSFPGMHGPADALAYGVKITGCTVFFVAGGVDDGPVIAQAAVAVEDDDDVDTLHERIKTAERALLVDVVGRLARLGWTIDIGKRKVTLP
ncbi:MAG: phosphoribosylglycinamide formyltransferase [Catenulispora sp.]|nr:phosphoribosylglycinamide formyltransferase [Catenulispora sp.]